MGVLKSYGCHNFTVSKCAWSLFFEYSIKLTGLNKIRYRKPSVKIFFSESTKKKGDDNLRILTLKDVALMRVVGVVFRYNSSQSSAQTREKKY